MYKGTIFDLTGKNALITGGSKGIGKAIASVFAEAGANIVITGRDEEVLKATAREINEKSGRKVNYYQFDHANWTDTPKLTAKILDQVGNIDILVNNAGTGMVKEIEAIENSEWERLYGLVISSPMAMSRELIPGMKKKRWGRIINISSILGTVGREKRSPYCCFKGAVQSFSRALALEVCDFNINVNSISPGQIHTPLTEGMWNDPEKYNSVTALIPFKRWGTPDEIKGTALLLASEAGSYITGQNILVDGGWSIW